MPHNSQYSCPRRGNMYQNQECGFFCSYHDRFSKTRCQAYFEFRDSGMQCSEIRSTIDAKTGKLLCAKHDPNSEYTNRRCQAVLVTDSGDYQCPALHSVVDHQSGMRYCHRHYLPCPITDSSDDNLKSYTSESPHLQPADRTANPTTRWLNTVAATSPPYVTTTNTTHTAETRHETLALTTPPEATKVAPKLSTSVPETMVPRPSAPTPDPCKLTPESRPDGPSRKDSTGVKAGHESRTRGPADQHFAALYALCNICLEKHSLINMRKVEPCGHEFKEACLREVLRGRGVRRFNCSSCAGWFRREQGVEQDI